MPFRRKLAICLIAAALAAPVALYAAPTPELSGTFHCDQIPPEAQMSPPWGSSASPLEWVTFVERDFKNQACAVQRIEDQFRNDEAQERWLMDALESYPEGVEQQTEEPDRPRTSTARLVFGANAADPFRNSDDWAQDTGGQVIPISFIASRNGAKLEGEIWRPPTSAGNGPYPGVVIAPGASQQHRQLYYWAAQGLAEEGYLVMIFDFQGQGDSENLGHNPDRSPCTTLQIRTDNPRESSGCLVEMVPPDLNFNGAPYLQATQDAIRFFFSHPGSPYGAILPNYADTDLYNPLWNLLDKNKVGLAGHSVGAIAVNDAGHLDQRIKAVVRWGFTGVINPAFSSAAHAPTLIVANDYSTKGPQPWFTIDPTNSGQIEPLMNQGFNELYTKGISVMQVVLRASTHFEWTYGPGRWASRYGERVSFYYTLSWFDAFLKGLTDDAKRAQAFTRLTTHTYDNSADVRSRGAGIYQFDSSAGAYRNFPYKIEGFSLRQRLSYMWKSRYWLKGGGLICNDMRAQTCVPG